MPVHAFLKGGHAVLMVQKHEKSPFLADVRQPPPGQKHPRRSTLLAAQAVEIDDDDDQAAGDDSLPEWIHIQQIGTVVDGGQNEGTEQGTVNGPDRTEKTGAADNGGGDRLQFPSFRRSGVADTDPGRQQDPDERGAECREHVGNVDHPGGVDARKPGRFHVRTNGKDVATEPAMMQKYVGRDGHDYHHPEEVREEKKGPSRKAGELIVGNRNGGTIGHQEANAA